MGVTCLVLAVGVALLATLGCSRREGGEGNASNSGESGAVGTATPSNQNNTYRGRLGSESAKVRSEDGKTYVWAGGDPSGPGARWYDFTGSSIPAADLQFGIGKDKIASIDDPLFVAPDDRRLLGLPPSPYRPNERPKTTDEIRVIGHVENGDARAYPIALLDQHELVNDHIGGKPVAVGW
jgi:hypothetical protein